MGQELQAETRERPLRWEFKCALHGIGQEISPAILLGSFWDPPEILLRFFWCFSWHSPDGFQGIFLSRVGD